MFLISILCGLPDDEAILQVDGAVGGLRKFFVMCHDDKGLSELISQVEEELVQFCLVFRVQTS